MRALPEMRLGFCIRWLMLLGVQYGFRDGHPSLAIQPPSEAALEAKDGMDQVMSSSFAQNLFCSSSGQNTCGMR